VLRRLRQLHFRPQLLVLLFTWALSLLAPALHVDEADGADGSHGARGGHSASECLGIAAGHHHARGVELSAGCDGDNCHVPTHHHHPLFHHDATRCPACASAFERVADVPNFSFDTTRLAVVAAVAPIRLPNPSERHVIALARGPPAERSLPTVGTSAV